MLQDSRLFRIVYYLLDKGKCTAPELADKFEVSTRTIYRDLDVISAAGIPIYATQGKGGGISILPEYVMDNALLSDEEKEKIVIPVIEFKKTLQQTCREYDISSGLLSRWIEKYKAEGISGLENKRKPGNPMAKYFTTKKFNSKEEELEYENMRLKIENERLKKGYIVKGDGSIVVFKK